MATIKEIAKLAGVSHVTVSKVLGGEIPVSRPAAVRRAKKIQQIADELGYRPNHTAQALRTGRTGLIAVLGNTPLSFDDHNLEEANILRRVAAMLREEGLNLSAQLCDRAEKNGLLPPWRVDAAILIAAYSSDQTEDVEKDGLPYVAFNGECGPNGSSVQFDDKAGVLMAMRALRRVGHERIAYMSNYKPYDHRSVPLRLEGYHEAMREAGQEPLPTYPNGGVSESEVAEHLGMLVREHGCTAIVCWDPWVALYAYRAAREIGLDLPGDLSVIAFNDTPLGSQALQPRLSAVTRPVEATARAMVELLNERMSSDVVAARSITVTPDVVVRESIAPPRQRGGVS
ncbi:LacI family DNA-binding transcriptional regulator [Mucisphaera calidilacus]|uniref:Putative HTH-type transcriptional repressor ExuR n=1 Tax=Mucisphaera calidilacus TaxID=2527982 RepID=A0A518BU54_9BACT|nr:LacI family DNA-binding transcriptional regulator [Mucisphaera calidilacus]QDU70486.1 putative HTH-type transcriptional repressor ExuR [Mucisphaera calidilacus]